jgi:phosphoribosylanthranilate isomerase
MSKKPIKRMFSLQRREELKSADRWARVLKAWRAVRSAPEPELNVLGQLTLIAIDVEFGGALGEGQTDELRDAVNNLAAELIAAGELTEEELEEAIAEEELEADIESVVASTGAKPRDPRPS